MPHIYAETDEALAYGLGWAQACNHGDLILRLFGQARGRAAEYWGTDYLEQDRQLRRLQIPVRSQAWLAAQDAPMGRWLNSFAAGINEYAAQHPDRIDAKRSLVGSILAAGHGARLRRAFAPGGRGGSVWAARRSRRFVSHRADA